MSFFSNDDSSIAILIDVGSGSMTASLVLYKINVNPVFLYTISRSFTVPDKPDSAKLIDNMLKTLDELVLEVLQNGFVNHKKINLGQKNIKNVVISFSSPWFLPKTKFLEIKKDKAFVVTESFLKDLTKNEEDLFKNEIKEHQENITDDFSVIENSIVHIKVNGYIISKIIGQKITTLNAFLCMSLVSRGVLEKVDDIIAKHTHISREKVITHTFPVVSFSVFRDLFNGFQDFILMDVTSEVTDMTLVSNDVLVKTTSIPLGRNYIIRQIAKDFSVPSEIAESNLSLYASQKLDNETTEKVEKVLAEIEKEWSIYLERSLQELSPEFALPSRVYLTCNNDISGIFNNYIKLSKADVTSNFRKSANIIRIDDKLLSSLYQNDSHTLPNEYICLLAIFWNKFAFK